MSTTLFPPNRAARGAARRRPRFSIPRIDSATVTPTLLGSRSPSRLAAAGTVAIALLLCLPGTSLAASRPDGDDAPRLIARGAGYAVGGGSTRVREVQRALRNAAYAPGPVDGLYGPLTEAAVQRFQQAHGLAIDGVVGPQTRSALRAVQASQHRSPAGTNVIRPGAGYRSPGGSERVLEVQRLLQSLRYETGPLDGLFGPRTQAAVQWFQVHRGFRPTGIVDPATLRRLRALSRGAPEIGDAAAASELHVPPLPAAGWHGRPIRHPHRHTGPATSQRAARAHPLRPGAGYRSMAGSQRVRRVQRTLRRLGYRPGPADGRFGARTKAAVQWFQLKQGLRPHGRVDATTFEHLRAAASPGGAAPPEQSDAPPSRAGRPPSAATAPGSRPAEGAGEQGGGVSPLPILLAALGVAAVCLLTLRRTASRRAPQVPPPDSTPRTAPAPTNPHAGAGGSASPAPAPATAATEHSSSVVGYASAHDRAELERQAAAIERACRERGWTLACVIRENGSANGNGHKRPGLAHAAKQVRAGVGGRLVVESLDHLGPAKGEVRARLHWLAGLDIDLVALDANGNGNVSARHRRPRRAPT
jgi:peptidoglycan hydrolase-like protein with peptidoglycan-binding domain